jgi:hypothetical protein
VYRPDNRTDVLLIAVGVWVTTRYCNSNAVRYVKKKVYQFDLQPELRVRVPFIGKSDSDLPHRAVCYRYMIRDTRVIVDIIRHSLNDTTHSSW